MGEYAAREWVGALERQRNFSAEVGSTSVFCRSHSQAMADGVLERSRRKGASH